MKSDAPLRIAQLSPLWTRVPPATYGGVELLLKLLIDELAARGHEVTLFGTGDCAVAGTVRAVCEVNLYERFARGEGYMYEYYANALMAEALKAAGEFDVIHSHLAPGWLPLGAVSPTPMLWTAHTNLHRDDEWALRRFPEVEVAGISAHQMRAVSLALGREFPVVYNGCDFGAYDPNFEPGEYLAFLGRMSPAKNPAGAVRIAKACGLPIVLAGQPQNASEEKYFTDEVKPLIFPIQWDEPFGLVMIEAMACGTPVVAHRRGSVAEVVDDGVTGFHGGALDGLAELVPHALSLDRRSVRAHAESRFGFARMVDDYLALYRQMASRKAAGVIGAR